MLKMLVLDITDDVIGYLTNDDVLDLLERIKNL